MTQVVEKTDIDPVTGKGRVAHIVKPSHNKSASTLILEGRIEGIEVEALCGHTWIPSRDPKQYPVCDRCKEIWNEMSLSGNYRDG